MTLIVSMVDFRELIGEKYPSTLLRDPYEVTKMRSAILTAIVLTLAMAFSSMTATASTSTVTLSFPTTGTITFAPSGGGPVMTVAGPLTGEALNGTGVFAGATSFTLSGSVVFTVTPGDPDGYAGTGTLNFATNNGFTGTLSNITLDQTGQRAFLNATLNGQTVSMIIDLPSSTPISKLKGTELGKFSAGVGGTAVTPEPGTMLLFGSGLLLVAGVLRRRLIA